MVKPLLTIFHFILKKEIKTAPGRKNGSWQIRDASLKKWVYGSGLSGAWIHKDVGHQRFEQDPRI